MKKIMFIILLVLEYLNGVSQNQQANLEKYWRYRQRLRDKFIVVSDDVEFPGVNIPATSLDLDQLIMGWPDGNQNMSHYLSILATEYKLLNNNSQNTTTTIKELYYAMMAIERLDLFSEGYLRLKNGHQTNRTDNDRNGFFIRDDVNTDFWNQYHSHFGLGPSSASYNSIGKESLEGISQDNIYHLFEGLSLVSKLVGKASVADIPIVFFPSASPYQYLIDNGIKVNDLVDFSLWANKILLRIIEMMQHNDIECCGVSKWYIWDPVNSRLVDEGSGSDCDMYLYYSTGVVGTINNITGEYRPWNDSDNPLHLTNFIYFFESDAIITIPGTPITIIKDCYKIRSLATTSNILGSGLTYGHLKTQPNSTQPYEHFPLIYLILNDDDEVLDIQLSPSTTYPRNSVYYEDLLNSAPCDGPRSKDVGFGTYNFDWSSTSRCVWPEELGMKTSYNILFSGMDYMMLHNLYYLAFHRDDFKTIDIDCNADPYKVSAGIINSICALNSGDYTYKASYGITLKPGFLASGYNGTTLNCSIGPLVGEYLGKNFEYIEQNNCYSEKSTIMYIEPTIQNEIKDDKVILNNNELFGNNAAIEEVSLYPNPNNGSVIHISVNNINNDILNIEINNSVGNKLYNKMINATDITIDLNNLPDGFYILKITMPNKTICKTFLITR